MLNKAKALKTVGKSIGKQIKTIAKAIAKNASSYTPPSNGTYTVIPHKNELWNVGEKYVSPNGKYNIIQQGDGNLVIYGPSGAVWALQNIGISYTSGSRFKFNNGHALIWDKNTNKFVAHIVDRFNNRNDEILALDVSGSLSIRKKDDINKAIVYIYKSPATIHIENLQNKTRRLR